MAVRAHSLSPDDEYCASLRASAKPRWRIYARLSATRVDGTGKTGPCGELLQPNTSAYVQRCSKPSSTNVSFQFLQDHGAIIASRNGRKQRWHALDQGSMKQGIFSIDPARRRPRRHSCHIIRGWGSNAKPSASDAHRAAEEVEELLMVQPSPQRKTRVAF